MGRVPAARRRDPRLGGLGKDVHGRRVYEEHNLGVFRGQNAIEDWIVSCMAEYPAMTLWIEWAVIDGDRIGFYVWNNLPDPGPDLSKAP